MQNHPPASEQQQDEQWLAALRGQPHSEAAPLLNQQAAAVRQALQAHQQTIHQAVPEADEAGYQRLMAELNRQGLIKPQTATSPWQYLQIQIQKITRVFVSHPGAEPQSSNSDNRHTALDTNHDHDAVPVFSRSPRTAQVPDVPSKPSAHAYLATLFKPAYIGIAASLMLCLVLVLQMLPEQDADDVMRGGETTLIVADPAARADELERELKALDAAPVRTIDANGNIRLTFNATESVLDYLMEQRIEVKVENKKSTITITKKKIK